MARANSTGRGRPATAPEAARWPAGLTASAAVIGPAFGAIIGDETGSATSPVFLLCTLLSTVFVAWSVTSAGLWWLLCAAPAIIAVASIGAELLFHPTRPPYEGTKQQLVGVAHGTVHSFPVMAITEAVLLGVVIFRYVRSRQAAAPAPSARVGGPRQGQGHGRSARV